jgi:PhzF family phenazine biosynthesis protein
MNAIPLFQVDAFTSAAFKGNPAAVCLLEKPASDQWMQQVAAEMNLAETAFLTPDPAGLRLRWMTPTTEVDLCGHATIATVQVLRELHATNTLPDWKQSCIQFQSRSGILTAEATANGIVLDFPATVPSASTPPAAITTALRINPEQLLWCGQSRFDLLLRLDSAATIRQLQPDLQQLAELPVRGVIVTALGDAADHDFISRFFAPASGVPEDPVTGSAHCTLAPFWQPHFGRNTLFGFQASSRGGHVRMDLQGDRVRLTGHAVTVFQGSLRV